MGLAAGTRAFFSDRRPRRPHPAASNARPKISASAAARLRDGERATTITDRLRPMVRTIAETPADARGKSAASRAIAFGRGWIGRRRRTIRSAFVCVGWRFRVVRA